MTRSNIVGRAWVSSWTSPPFIFISRHKHFSDKVSTAPPSQGQYHKIPQLGIFSQARDGTFDVALWDTDPRGTFAYVGLSIQYWRESGGERDHQRKYIEDEMCESGFTLHFRDQLSTKYCKSGLGLSQDNYQSLNDNRFSFIEENIKKCQHSLVF